MISEPRTKPIPRPLDENAVKALLRLPSPEYMYAFDLAALYASRSQGKIVIISDDEYCANELRRRLEGRDIHLLTSPPAPLSQNDEGEVWAETVIAWLPEVLPVVPNVQQLILIEPGALYRFLPDANRSDAKIPLRTNIEKGWDEVDLPQQLTIGLHTPISIAWSYALRLCQRIGREAWADRCLYQMRKVYTACGWQANLGTLKVNIYGGLDGKDAVPANTQISVEISNRMSAAATQPENALLKAALKADAWFDTMLTPDGYGGPVAHWWQNSLQYTGAGLDWRYEGIILGYLKLHAKTGDNRWLAKARRAGDHLVQGQLPTGNFRNSQFQINPYTGGTPHEAAADIGLLKLAAALKASDDANWQLYLETAKRNLDEFYIQRLWNPDKQWFADNLSHTTFVPNKAATLTEALFALANLTGDSRYLDQYALPTLHHIMQHQVRRGGKLRGAVCQLSEGGRRIAWFFPYYAARCVPGLLLGYAYTHEQSLLDSAAAALDFILQWRHDDGSIAQIVYTETQVNRYPVWIAAVGDVLLAYQALKAHGYSADMTSTEHWLLNGQTAMGGFRTAHGFGSQISQRTPDSTPDFRDLLPVCGWGDKAFRYITTVLPAPAKLVSPPASNYWGGELGEGQNRIQPIALPCRVRGKPAESEYYEDAQLIEIRQRERVLYRWRKGQNWAEISTPEVIWK